MQAGPPSPMKYKVELFANLRIGREVFYPGVYRVPTDMTDEIAKRAIEHGAARIDPPAPVPGQSAYARRVPRRKTPAPENKALEAAPENKSAGDAADDHTSLV